jgi:hypothetical protein
LFKSWFLNFLYRIQERYGFHHKLVTHIEGGLGSQILGIILFYNMQDEFGEKKAKCNLSYFRHFERTKLWDWSLHNYGIHLEEMKSFESDSKYDFLRKKKDFLTESEISQEYWKKSRLKYIDRFPINEEKMNNFLQNASGDSNIQSFAAIHIRRGDYLQVASRVVSIDEYISFLEKIRTILPRNLFVITDSVFTIGEKLRLSQTIGENCNAIFLDGPGHDPFVLHCLMRRADVLITSNSTFSFSAGLLGKEGQVVFSPLKFHAGTGSEKYNRTFRSLGSFVSWNLDNSRDII